MKTYITTKFLLSFTIFFIITTVVLSDDSKINKIDIKGTQRIDIETVISYSNIEIGDIYTEEFGNQILKELFDTNLFSNLEISFDANTSFIKLRENPTILVKFSEIVRLKMKIYIEIF